MHNCKQCNQEFQTLDKLRRHSKNNLCYMYQHKILKSKCYLSTHGNNEP